MKEIQIELSNVWGTTDGTGCTLFPQCYCEDEVCSCRLYMDKNEVEELLALISETAKNNGV